MTDIEFKIVEEYATVGFRKKDDYTFTAWYLTEAESLALRTRLFELIQNRGS